MSFLKPIINDLNILLSNPNTHSVKSAAKSLSREAQLTDIVGYVAPVALLVVAAVSLSGLIPHQALSWTAVGGGLGMVGLSLINCRSWKQVKDNRSHVFGCLILGLGSIALGSLGLTGMLSTKVLCYSLIGLNGSVACLRFLGLTHKVIQKSTHFEIVY